MVAATSVLHNLFLFRRPIFENGDEAANSILVNRALHLSLLVGNYSREHFNHPGPALLYVQAAGQALFSSLLHAVPAPYNGQVLGVIALNAALIALTALVVYRRLGSPVLAVGFVLVILFVTSERLAWALTWMPYMYAAPFLLAVVAGASLAAGNLGDLPLYVVATGLLVHGNVVFVPVMGAYTLAVAVPLMVRWRRAGTLMQVARENRRALGISCGLVLLFLLPIVLELVLHWPGPWASYWDYSRVSHPRSMSQVIAFVAGFWSHRPWEQALFAGSVVLAVGMIVTEPDVDRRRFLAALLASCALQTLVFAAYVARSIDLLRNYEGFFYFVVPAVIVATAVVSTLARISGMVAEGAGIGTEVRSWARPAAGIAAAALVVVVGASRWHSPSFSFSYRGDPGLPSLTTSLAKDRPAAAKTVVIDLPWTYPWTYGWPDITGLIVAASRQGYDVCVAQPRLEFMVTAQYVCSPGQEAGALRILVVPRGFSLPRGWSRLAGDPSMTVATS